MDTMLRAVLDTDHRESERTEQLIKTREMLFDEMRAQKEALFAAAREKAGSDITAIADQLAEKHRERIAVLHSQGETALRRLTECGDAHREEWAAEIVRLVLDDGA